MEIVFGAHHLIAPGGADTYLLTVTEQLERLGHRVTIHALEQGELADWARARGFNVAAGERDLPERADALLSHDGATAPLLAQRYPEAPLVYVIHSEIFTIDTPPQIPDVASVVVALSDRVARHAAGLAEPVEIVRLRQPIDTQRFSPRGDPQARPRVALVMGNYLRGGRRELLRSALEQLGVQVLAVGVDGEVTPEPETVISAADAVFGKGRVILEAMACGRPAFVYDWFGADGWVTPETYPAMEADAFAGLSDGETTGDVSQLAEQIARYDAGMGIANRELALKHHAAHEHAVELVELVQRLGARKTSGAPLGEMSRLTRQGWIYQSRTEELTRDLHDLRNELNHTRTLLETAEGQRDEAIALWKEVEEFKQSARWRLAERLGSSLDRVRRRGRRSQPR
jgi:hypothetical protein